MSDVPLQAPFDAYMGKEPYLFVSYSHKDGEKVFPELARLHSLGYRVWYDEGIDPGSEWPEEVAVALEGASHFLVFISPNAVVSQNVRNEINFALNRQKPFLAIYVQETDLPPGLQLRMGDIQAIMRYRMSDDHYFRKMEKSLPATLVSPTRTNPSEALAQEGKQTPNRPAGRRDSGSPRMSDIPASGKTVEEAASLFKRAVRLNEYGDVEAALPLYKEVEAICGERGELSGLAKSLGDQALILQENGALQEALSLCEKESAVWREIGDNHRVQRSLGRQADILDALGRPEEALRVLEAQDKILRTARQPDASAMARSLLRRAKILADKMGRASEALPLLEEAYHLTGSGPSTALEKLAKEIEPFLRHLRSGQGDAGQPSN